MLTITTTYLLPAIILNPAFLMHLVNTFVSHYFPPPPTPSVSRSPVFEKLGPLPGTTLYLDMHADDQLCWGYTILMVIVQLIAFGKVSNNRIRKKSARAAAKAARIEKERSRQDKLDKYQAQRHEFMAKLNDIGVQTDGTTDSFEEPRTVNGNSFPIKGSKHSRNESETSIILESEASMTETSEEEMIV